MKRVLVSILLTVLFSYPAFAGVPVTGVELKTRDMTLTLGMDDNWLLATVSPSDATNKRVIWSSSNEAVVSVDSGGVGRLYAVAPGTASVTVTTEDGGFNDSCTVVVVDTGIRNAFAEFFSDKGEAAAKMAEFNEGDLETVDGGVAIIKSITESIAMKLSDDIIEATSLPSFKAEVQSGKTAAVRRIAIRMSLLKTPLLLSNLDKVLLLSIISPDAGELLKYAPMLDDLDDGMYTIMPMAGIPEYEPGCEVVVCIKDGGRFDLDKTENGVVVGQIVILGKAGSGEYVVLNKNTTSIQVGGSEKLITTVFPADNKLTWSSSNANIATVDSSGLVTGISSGSVIITAMTESGYTSNCYVSVNSAPPPPPPPQPQPITIIVDGTEQLVIPGASIGTSFTWSSSNTSIATVSDSGIVMGVSTGTVIITATSEDGGYAASWAVTVVEDSNTNGVSIAPSSASIKVGSVQQLWATIQPFNVINNMDVIWSSSNTAIATVDASGLVMGVSIGTATITVTTKDEEHSATCEVTVFNESGGFGNRSSGGGCSAQNLGMISFALMIALAFLPRFRKSSD